MKFVRHFRIYFKNNHPAYIVDEEGNEYIFHKVTHSKTSGGRKNWKIIPNPLSNSNEAMYIVKKEQKDKKNRFSPYTLKTKNWVDFSYPEIKRARSTQTNLDFNLGRTNVSSSKNSKINERNNVNKKTGSTQTRSRATNATSKNIKQPRKRKVNK